MFIAPPLYLVRRDKQTWLDPLFKSKEEAEAAAVAQNLDLEKAVEEACTTPHAVDACAIASWLSKTDRDGFLPRYFQPPFADDESIFALREG
ncbi:MAG TPA: hypothetical protein VNK24_09000 [Elusimicrobiota bacterium]|nr:hypothetical protein [Elusimicrobiota bacterium]